MYRHLHSKRCSCINGYDVEASDGSRKIINFGRLESMQGSSLKEKNKRPNGTGKRSIKLQKRHIRRHKRRTSNFQKRVKKEFRKMKRKLR